MPEGVMARTRAEHPYPLAFMTVSGAHLYGFPSADSDIDLRGVHLLPVEEVVGLAEGRETVTRTFEHSGAEIDLVTHDLAKFCRMLLSRNGYVLEQVMSPLVVESGPVHEELKARVPKLVTSLHAHHYLGFARNQWNLFERRAELKPLLYTFRVLLTGVHLMRTGEVVADLNALAAEYGPAYLHELIEAKREAEHAPPPAGAPGRDRLGADVVALTIRLEEERDSSALPAESPGSGGLNDLVVRTRLATIGR
ncbi:nucleotidyltransferase domain-containing protein [Actinomadura alba]|uniref:Nucleotidyltransferase domain-containing protein n=1 Tax=Actinomadura alba TaxID=406431 RepID=A0ABR7LJE3_9ACTN|nr:nucleotidyltransferase domain-containing protein [Actinomadura alba]MBC6464975.1 nucleotidyltransferase domain-containing protein [Actinomadura alba]